MASQFQEKKWFIKRNDINIGPLSYVNLIVWALQGFLFPDDVLIYEKGLRAHAADLISLSPLLHNQKGKRRPLIWAVSGGKGGVGKSVLSAMFGIALASLGIKTIIIDADFGGPDLHALFGINNSAPDYYDFAKGKNIKLGEIAIPSSFDNLKLILGARGELGAANPFFFKKLKFLQAVRNLNAQYIILDLGPGTEYNNLDYFIAADIGIIITTPEPTSIQNASGFLKSSFKRKADIAIQSLISNGRRKGIEEYSNNSTILQQLINRMEELKLPGDAILERVFRNLDIKLVINMAFSEEDNKNIGLLSKYLARELGMQLDFVGSACFDPKLRQALLKSQLSTISTRSNPFFEDCLYIVQELMKHKTVEHVKLPISQLYKEKGEKDKGDICGIRCRAWEDCEFKVPGHVCRVRMII